jgi:hypothetical protein
MDDNTFKILDYLDPKGVGIRDDITNPLSEIFIVTDTTSDSTKHTASLLQGFLDYLISENLIYMNDRPDKSLGEGHPPQGYRWLVGDWPIGAAITLNGHNLLRLEKERRSGIDLETSVKNTNISVKDTNYWVKRASIASAVIAMLTLVYIVSQKGIEASLQTLAADSTKNVLIETK